MPPHIGNLTGYRILDLTDESGFLAGKLLAELGADVIKVEAPDGDAARRRGPFVGGIADLNRSILWLALNTSKRGITLDLNRPHGTGLFLRLCDSADAIIVSAPPTSPQSLTARRLSYETLHARNPRLVVCSLTPFGETGPYSGYRGSDLSALALGGNLYPTGNPDRAPVRCALPVSYYHGGIEAAVATVFALYGRELTGEGQLVDVSLQEAMCMANMTTPTQFPLTGFKGGRVGGGFRGGSAYFRELWPCQDGFVSFALRGGPARIPGIKALVQYMDESNLAPPCLKDRDWSKYNHNTITQAEVDEIETALSTFFGARTMKELFETACERNLMLAPANTAREIVDSRQLLAREFFVDINHEDLGVTLKYPGAFAKTSLGGVAVRGPAPRLGQHNDEIYGSLGVDVQGLAADRII